MEPWEQEELAKMPEWAEGYDARTAGQFVCPRSLPLKQRKAWWGGWIEKHQQIIGIPTPPDSP